ncbi:MAG: NAD kinase [Arachidicoccus sp.]|nr:NAD kinase [Arachidicoccus sp.]
MQIAIYGRILPDEYKKDVFSLLEELRKTRVQVFLFHTFFLQYPEISAQFPNIQPFHTAEELTGDTEFLLSLGGDGTILDTITFVKKNNIPILGVNFGRLGFLTGTSRENFSSAIEDLVNRNYIIDKRSLLHLEANIPLFDDAPFALNDFTICKRDIDPMIRVHTFLNGEYINSYFSDGLIVSTPTGSTGYNMSCDGPILFPDAASFVLTPIAPHHLNTRPIIIQDDNVLSFEIESRSDNFLCTLDSRREIVHKNTQLAIRKENFKIKLIRFKENTFLSTLRNKLGWGIDKRN